MYDFKKEIKKYEVIEDIYYKGGSGYESYLAKKYLTIGTVLFLMTFSILFYVVISNFAIEKTLASALVTIPCLIFAITIVGFVHLFVILFNKTKIFSKYKEKYKYELYVTMKDMPVRETDSNGMRYIKLKYDKKLGKLCKVVTDKKIDRDFILDKLDGRKEAEEKLNLIIKEKGVEGVIKFIEDNDKLLDEIIENKKTNNEEYKEGIIKIFNKIEKL